MQLTWGSWEVLTALLFQFLVSAAVPKDFHPPPATAPKLRGKFSNIPKLVTAEVICALPRQTDRVVWASSRNGVVWPAVELPSALIAEPRNPGSIIWNGDCVSVRITGRGCFCLICWHSDHFFYLREVHFTTQYISKYSLLWRILYRNGRFYHLEIGSQLRPRI